jgi:uncharacterized sulfatase
MKRSLIFTAGVVMAANVYASPKPERPNILFVLMDDLGYGHFAPNNDQLMTSQFNQDFVRYAMNPLPESSIKVHHHPNNPIQPYGPKEALEFSKRATPTLTKLSEAGVIFSSAFACNSLCAPSRLGIATGMNPSHYGVYENSDIENRGLDQGSHLAEKLHNMGYATAHIGKWHIGRRDDQIIKKLLLKHGLDTNPGMVMLKEQHPEAYNDISACGFAGSVVPENNPIQNGFDYYFGYNNWASQFYNSTLVWENYNHAGIQKTYNTDVFTDTALTFIRKQVEIKKPFYVQLFFHAVHDSLKPKAPDKYFNQFNSSSYDLNNFYAHVYGVDANIKRIVDYLKAENVLDNTIIVFTSDNGAESGGPSVLPGNAPYSGHKGTYYQGGFGVPLFFYWPAKIKKPYHSDLIVSTIDILPTLIDAAEGVVPDKLDGKSLLPVLLQRSDKPVHEYLYWAGLHSTYWGFLINKTLRNDLQVAPFAWAILKDGFILRYVGTVESNLYSDFPDGRAPHFELYNTISDPAETHNLMSELPEKGKELISLYYKKANGFLPPVKWSREKWEEIMPPKK